MMFVINFCLENYRLILDLLSIVIVIVFFIIKKKPVNSILEAIYQCALLAILDSEKTDLKGKEKLEYAVHLVNKWLGEKYPNLDLNRYHYLIVNTIEIILSTPQKKGEQDGK